MSTMWVCRRQWPWVCGWLGSLWFLLCICKAFTGLVYIYILGIYILHSIYEGLFLTPICLLHLLKSLLNPWLVPQFFAPNRTSTSGCPNCSYAFHFPVRMSTLTVNAPIEPALEGSVKLLVFTVFSALVKWTTSVSEPVWRVGGMGWKQIQATTLPQTHSPDPEFSKLLGINAPIIGCLGSVSRALKWLWFVWRFCPVL